MMPTRKPRARRDISGLHRRTPLPPPETPPEPLDGSIEPPEDEADEDEAPRPEILYINGKHFVPAFRDQPGARVIEGREGVWCEIGHRVVWEVHDPDGQPIASFRGVNFFRRALDPEELMRDKSYEYAHELAREMSAKTGKNYTVVDDGALFGPTSGPGWG